MLVSKVQTTEKDIFPFNILFSDHVEAFLAGLYGHATLFFGFSFSLSVAALAVGVWMERRRKPVAVRGRARSD